MILDEGSFEEWGADIGDRNALDFPGYEEKLDAVGRKPISGKQSPLEREKSKVRMWFLESVMPGFS